MPSYNVRRIAHLETVTLRGLRFQMYRWHGGGSAPIVLLHGWGDTGETFQFLVDCLPATRTVLAFDQRGFGRTEWPQDGYWFPDYLADLDAMLHAVSPMSPVDIVGHSLGGNVAMLYTGVRPERVRRVVSLDGLGVARSSADQAPARYREWLEEVRVGARYATYENLGQLLMVLGRRNPRTPGDRLDFIARSWSHEKDGRIELRADPRHKRVNPVLYQRDQVEVCWREIGAPFLLVTGGLSDMMKRVIGELDDDHLRKLLPTVVHKTIPEAGHMMHHECPEAVADLLEPFLFTPD
jgi:pimeloyl-ACP methyl ester carboxylesterase